MLPDTTHILSPDTKTRGKVLNALLKQMRTAFAALPFALLGVVSGCGGGNTQLPIAPYSPYTGVFVDAPVTGLNYRTTSGAAGNTDAQGHFNYALGDIVTFSTGGVILGMAIPVVTPAGNTVVTPVDLAGGGGTSSAPAQLIGEVLGTLNSIAIARNVAGNLPLSSGVFGIVQSDATALFTPLVAPYLYPPLFIPPPFLTLYDFPLTSTVPTIPSVQSQLQAEVAAVSGVASVTTAATATLNMNQGVNAAGVIGTVWKGTCAICTPVTDGTFYFQPDGNITGFTSDGNILAGTWAGSTAAPPAAQAVQFALMSSPLGATYSGTIASGATTAVINDSGGVAAFNITKAVSSSLLTNNLYLGGWYGVYTPAGSTDVYGDGTPVYLILSPDGTFSGVMDGNQANTGIIGGTWTPSNPYGMPVSGIGTGKFIGSTTATFSFNMATKSGLYLQNGNVVGTIAFSRTGVLSMNSSLTNIPMATVIQPVNITWPANPAALHSNFALAININSGGTYAIKSEANPLGNGPLGGGATSYTMTDNIPITYYPTGAGTYTWTVDPLVAGSCTPASGIGTITSPATISITCN